MKRIIASIAAIAIVASMVTACSSDNTNDKSTTQATTTTTAAANTGNDTANNQAAASANAGYSVYTYLSSSKPATAEANGSVEVNSYIVYTATAQDGKIFKSGVDAAQTRIGFTNGGQIADTTDLSASIKTKNELGDAYGMKKSSGIGKEWFEQAQALADWTIGKTLSEVSAAKITDKDGKAVYDEPDLVSAVTVTATTFQTPLSNSQAHKLSGTVGVTDKMGLGVSTKISSSKSATADAAGVGQVDSLLCVVALDSAGKITACGFDAIQSKVNFAADGTISTDLTATIKTKAELKDDYGMRKNSAIGKEWNEQAVSFAEWCIGKSVNEVTGMQVKKVDDNHPKVPDVADLSSSVTISVGDFLDALEKAASYAK